MHGIEVVGALHEPTHPRPLTGGEQAFVGVLSVPLLGGVRGGFRVPMHAKKRTEAFHKRLYSTPKNVRGWNERAWTVRRDARAFFISESPSSAALGMFSSLVDGDLEPGKQQRNGFARTVRVQPVGVPGLFRIDLRVARSVRRVRW